jgi:hypothetical protein
MHRSQEGNKLYRYALRRVWSTAPLMAFVMLNPSTADGETDDPTLRRCIAFAKRERCGSLVVVNRFAYRATDPQDLAKSINDFGPQYAIGALNDEYVTQAIQDASIVVCAWGASPLVKHSPLPALHRAYKSKLFCLGKTKNGSPKHPLYVLGDAPLVRFDNWIEP